uniref:Uncharacterized protein n=1 Tax=Romanomermis culicivorax TaxID=13658 RepID=A0A915JX17_ROMCU
MEEVEIVEDILEQEILEQVLEISEEESQASGQTDQLLIGGINSVQQEPIVEMKLCGLHICAMEKEENVPELECNAKCGRKATVEELDVSPIP